MTIPYYQELEKNKRCINFGYIENEKKQQELLLSPILGSYLSTTGALVNCTGGHKGNNFIYSIYYHGVRDLLCSNNDKLRLGIFTDYNSLEAHGKRTETLKKYLYDLTADDIRVFKTLLDKYYNWDYNFCSLNLAAIKNNLVGLITADIEIHEYFKQLNYLANWLVGTTGYKNIEVFGVILGQEAIIEVTDEYLSNALKDKNDFLVQLVGFDKIETTLRNTITTSRLNVNEAFFNYLLMEWQIHQIPKYVINIDKKKIQKVSVSDFSIVNNSGLERELEKEIKLIKKHVPLSERPNYFR